MRSLMCVVGVGVLVSLIGLAACGCGEDAPEAQARDKAAPNVIKQAAEKPAAEIAQKTCPVMGGAISKDVYTDHNGRRVYFCCQACVDTFKKDPEKYLAKVDAEIQKAKDAAKPGE